MSKSVRIFRRQQVDPHDDSKQDLADDEQEYGPDLSTDAIVCEGVVEGDQNNQRIDLENIIGYDDLYQSPVMLPPPKVVQTPDQPKDSQANFEDLPVITEDQARQALIEYVSTQCCWGKGAAQKLNFQRLQTFTSYHYILESFTESRSTEWTSEPYIMQSIDSPENGVAPGPWVILVEPTKMFEDETKKVEVPHTASIKDCHICDAKGYLICKKCVGRCVLYCSLCKNSPGKKVWKINDQGILVCRKICHFPCKRCNGSFPLSCHRCNGKGKVICFECKGHRKLKWYIKLTVTWTNRMDEHIYQRTELPKDLLNYVHGTIAHQETQPMLWPIVAFPEKEINDASERLLDKHYNQFSNERIRMQRHRIRAIPVTQCYYRYDGKNSMYYVYGRETRVHCPDYPDKGSCNIL